MTPRQRSKASCVAVPTPNTTGDAGTVRVAAGSTGRWKEATAMTGRAQVFGSKSVRSSYGMDTAGPGEAWRLDGACRVDPELWFEAGARHWAAAAHICLRHCPVLRQCGQALVAELNQGIRPVDGVVAGVRFSAAGRPRLTDHSRVRCARCAKPAPKADLQVEEAIAAYAIRKGAARCGTAAGYDMHLAWGEDPCRDCRAVHYRRNRVRP